MGVELALERAGTTTIPLRPTTSTRSWSLDGRVRVGGEVVGPGVLAYLGMGRDEGALETDGPARALLLGGAPFPEPVLMWWNFVARDPRGGVPGPPTMGGGRRPLRPGCASTLARIEVGPPPWERPEG